MTDREKADFLRKMNGKKFGYERLINGIWTRVKMPKLHWHAAYAWCSLTDNNMKNDEIAIRLIRL